MNMQIDTRCRINQIPLLLLILASCMLFVFATLGCESVSIQGTSTVLHKGETMLLRARKDEKITGSWKWDVFASDSLESLGITFRQANGCAEGKKGIECCESKEYCAMQRASNGPPGVVIVTLSVLNKDGVEQGRSQRLIELPLEKESETVGTDGGVGKESATDAGAGKESAVGKEGSNSESTGDAKPAEP